MYQAVSLFSFRVIGPLAWVLRVKCLILLYLVKILDFRIANFIFWLRLPYRRFKGI